MNSIDNKAGLAHDMVRTSRAVLPGGKAVGGVDKSSEVGKLGQASATQAAVKKDDAAETARPAPQNDVSETVEHLNNLMQDIRRELHFEVDEDSGKTIIKVIDVESQSLVRQIPSEQALEMVANLDSMRAGLLGKLQV